jgi:hypothetical protein
MMIYMPSYIYDYYLGNIKHMINILLFVRVTFIYFMLTYILLPAKVIISVISFILLLQC